MNDFSKLSYPSSAARTVATPLQAYITYLCGLFASLLQQRFKGEPPSLAAATAFLQWAEQDYRRASNATPASSHGDINTDGMNPFSRLQLNFALSPLESHLIILAGLAEEHEGFADIFSTLHPRQQPWPTPGLAAQLLCNDDDLRRQFRQVLESGRAFRNGLIRLEGEGPLFNRDLRLPAGLWSSLHGIELTEFMLPDAALTQLSGLYEWLESADVRRAQQALRRGGDFTLLVTAEEELTAWYRAIALCADAGLAALPVQNTPLGLSTAVSTGVMSDYQQRLAWYSVATGRIPLVCVRKSEAATSGDYALTQREQRGFSHFHGPLVLACRDSYGITVGQRPFLHVPVSRMSSRALRQMWAEALPALDSHAALLAARYPLEPWQAAQIAGDVAFAAEATGASAAAEQWTHDALSQVAVSLRLRATSPLQGGVQWVHPQSGWDHLVLPDQALSQLHSAVNRLRQQARVLDEWGFLAGKRGGRGVRLLFCGPPGTGKSLSAEVVAKALEVDLMVVDLSQVVSKWIGETEKNLATVFEAAERSRAVLFFDEADALFGKRTEVSDAHDRYANLETAYLLMRLERYDGLAILATNFRQNLDGAFTRRLDYIVEFEEPDREQRLALWRCHLPKDAPLATDVKLDELAAHFSVTGGLIRNASLTAAYLGADEGSIRRDHFLSALRSEYQKAGKSFREIPGTKTAVKQDSVRLSTAARPPPSPTTQKGNVHGR